MVQHIHHKQIEHKNIYLVFGCRTQDTLLYHQEMLQLQQSMPGFRYIPVLSRETWAGATGYVHAEYEALCTDKQAASFYLCGWKGMIDEARQRILDMGYDKKNIHLEIYG
jgi:CDP-4-dehydro-6-deoxyglucose reductase